MPKQEVVVGWTEINPDRRICMPVKKNIKKSIKNKINTIAVGGLHSILTTDKLLSVVKNERNSVTVLRTLLFFSKLKWSRLLNTETLSETKRSHEVLFTTRGLLIRGKNVMLKRQSTAAAAAITKTTKIFYKFPNR